MRISDGSSDVCSSDLLEGPWAAVDPRLGFAPAGRTGQRPGSGFSGFTLGGLRTSVDGEVISLAGAPIPGLYAAGRATSGVHGDGYVSGTSLGDGTLFGRRAGRTVASRTGRCCAPNLQFFRREPAAVPPRHPRGPSTREFTP